MPSSTWYHITGSALRLHVYAQPGAKTTNIVGLHGNALKIRLHAPPVDGKANEALLQYLATCFNVPVKQVTLLRGEKNRQKTFEIIDSLIHPASLFTNKP